MVIVGGGFGGLQAARALRWADVDVVLVDRRNHHVFQPLLYQVATAGLSPGDIASPIRWILRRQQNVQVLLGEAIRIDRRADVLHLDIGRVALRRADHRDRRDARLFRPRRLAGPCARPEDARGRRADPAAPAARVRARPSARPIRPNARRHLTFVIVGGGPTGVELAGALAELANYSLARDFRSIDTSWPR